VPRCVSADAAYPSHRRQHIAAIDGPDKPDHDEKGDPADKGNPVSWRACVPQTKRQF
jgi:hypothetical protein